MDNALPTAHPHDHHGHDHHGHAHHHGHGHRHAHEAHATPRPAARQEFSLVSLSAVQRLALVLPGLAALWLLAFWALRHG